MKLGIGDYYFSCKFNNVQQLGQAIFWNTIEMHAPEVINDLKANVLPLYNNVKDFPFESIAYYYDFLFRPDVCSTIDGEIMKDLCYIPEIVTLRRAIRDIVDKYYLKDEWLLERVFQKLFLWSNNDFLGCELNNVILAWEEACFKRHYSYKFSDKIAHIVELINKNKLPKFEFSQWNPFIETWESYVNELNQALRDYKKNIEQIIITNFKDVYKKSPVIKKPKQFEWLVRYQVQNWSLTKIAIHYLSINPSDKDYKAIKDSKKSIISMELHKLADMIDLTLRTDTKND